MRKIVGRQVKIEIAVRSGTQETSEMYFIRAENEKITAHSVVNLVADHTGKVIGQQKRKFLYGVEENAVVGFCVLHRRIIHGCFTKTGYGSKFFDYLHLKSLSFIFDNFLCRKTISKFLNIWYKKYNTRIHKCQT